ncbi:unnamed protein product [Camellia sinensis]
MRTTMYLLSYNVPPEHRFSLLTRIRYAHAFRSPRVCRLYSRVDDMNTTSHWIFPSSNPNTWHGSARNARFEMVKFSIRATPRRMETGFFSKIPPELFHHILKFLSSEDLVSCALVCRFLNFAASDESLWRRLITPPPISKTDFDKVVARQRPTVSKGDLHVHERFTREFGEEG